MKKFLGVSALTLALTACGGSSTDKKPDDKVVQNTAPTLSGSLTINTKALEPATLVVDVKDEQNDTITATIIDKPEWLNLSSKNNQVTFQIEPSLFDIANHTFTVEVSDGKATNQYTLIVNVAENREAWQSITLSDDDIIGNWHTKDASIQLIFASKDSGVLSHNGELSAFKWSNPDVVALNTHAIDCVLDCSQKALIEIDVLAKRDDALRVEFFNVSEDKGDVVTLYKTQPELRSHYYVDTRVSTFHTVNHLNTEAEESYFEFVLASSVPTPSGKTLFQPYADFSAMLNGTQLTITSDTLVNTYNTSQLHKDGYEFNVAFDLNLIDAEIIAQFDDFLVVKVSHNLTYHDEITPSQIAESAELVAAMQTQTSIGTFRRITPTAVPNLEIGTRYTGRLDNKIADTGEGLTLRYVPTHFAITAANQATVTFNTPKNDDSFKWHYTLDNNGETIKLTGNGSDTSLQFFTMHTGKMLYALERNKEERQARLAYELLEVIDETNITLADYKEVFSYLRQDFIIGNNKVFWFINDDGKGSYYFNSSFGETDATYFTPNAYWQLESDNSITFALMSLCPNADEFVSCKNEILANETGSYLSLANFKMLYKDGDKYIFDRLIWQRLYDYSDQVYKENVYQHSYWMGQQ